MKTLYGIVLSCALSIPLMGMEKPLTVIVHEEEYFPAHWLTNPQSIAQPEVAYTKQEPQSVTERIMAMSDYEKGYAVLVARAYRTYLGKAPNTDKTRKDFYLSYQKDATLCPVGVEGTRQIEEGLILLQQEEAQQKELEIKYSELKSSGAVMAFNLKEQTRMREPKKILDEIKTTPTDRPEITSPTTPQSPSSQPSKEVMQLLTSRKNKAFGASSDFGGRYKDENKLSLATLPEVAPDETENNFHKPAPAGAINIPSRSINRYN